MHDSEQYICKQLTDLDLLVLLLDYGDIRFITDNGQQNIIKSFVEELKRNKELAINEINRSSAGEFYVTKKGYKCYLHHKVVDLKYNRKQTIYYFALNKKEKDYLNINDLPKGKKIVESPKTGLPYVKSIR